MLYHIIPKNVPFNKPLAIDDSGEVLEYGEIESLRTYWKGALPQRSFVALLCDNTVKHLGAYLGLNAAGHVVVLLGKSIAPTAIESLVKVYGINAIIREVDGELTIQNTNDRPPKMHADLSICLTTSGSTGSAKLVRFRDDQLRANAEAIVEYLEISSVEKPYLFLPIEYSFGLSVLHSHMLVGATILLSKASVMEPIFWKRFPEATSFAGVPFHYEMLLKMRFQRKEFSKLRYLIQAGGKLTLSQAQSMHKIASEKGWKFHIMYGQTEAGPRISWLPHDFVGEFGHTIGRPIPGISMDVSPDGELIVRSPGIAMGYAQAPNDLELGDVFGGQIYTGDMVERLTNGFYHITGRKSRFLKLQGNRINLQEIENLLQNQDIEAYCSGRDDCLVIMTTSDLHDEIRQQIIQAFSFSPNSFKIKHIDEIPRKFNGKVDYQMLLSHLVRGGIDE